MNLGEKGELLAKCYLEKKGYSILEQNFRTRYGEIDIIAKFQEEIVFFEVKTRSDTDHGLPCEAVNKAKQRKIHGLSLIHISEPTRLGMISYAVFCLKKKT